MERKYSRKSSLRWVGIHINDPILSQYVEDHVDTRGIKILADVEDRIVEIYAPQTRGWITVSAEFSLGDDDERVFDDQNEIVPH